MDLLDLIEESEQSLDDRVQRAERGDFKDCEVLVADPDWRVRELVAEAGHLRHLEALCSDPEPKVRAAVAASGKRKYLEMLKDDESKIVQETIERMRK